MLQVSLDIGIQGGKSLFLRPLCGHDEATIDQNLPFSAVKLIDRLIVSTPTSTITAGMAMDLTIADRDLILVAIYQHYVGDQVEGITRCKSCDDDFELTFSLAERFEKNKKTKKSNITGPDKNGVFTLPDGTEFRLPNSIDLKNVLIFPEEIAEIELLKHCVVNSQNLDNAEQILIAMEEVGRGLSFELAATCPHCEQDQSIQFDIQEYVMSALAQEKRYLNYEVHNIAMAYRWSHAEILELTREQRRTFVTLIGAVTSAGAGDTL